MPRSDTTLKVGMMRTSTGSISVTKIIQKKKLRSGKRKYTMANEAMIEIAILPTAMATAITRLLSIMRPTGAAAPACEPPVRTCEEFYHRRAPDGHGYG